MTTATASQPLTSAEYFSAPGLSNSGMKHLAVSPMRYWHLFINPNRPVIETTPEMQIGSALHCAVLEPEKFDSRYACKVDTTDCLMTADDIKEWLRERGLPTTGKLKQDLIDRAVAADPDVRIFELVKEQHEAEHIGKTQFKQADWRRIQGMAEALRNEPAVQRILAEGQAEVPMFATDPETGVLLKSKMDWVKPATTLDVKTFSQQRGNSIDESVTKAIWYEGYHRQAYLYSLIRSLAEGKSGRSAAQTAPEFVFAFVESEEPYEVRIRSLQPKVAGEVNILWEYARRDVHGLIWLYNKCVQEFGDKPWRTSRNIDPLTDEEFPQVLFK